MSTTAGPACNICGTLVSDFKEPPQGARRICSGCGSVERQRVLELLYEDLISSDFSIAGKKALVVAPSRAERRVLQQAGLTDLASIDIRPEIKPDILADICSMPQVPSASFDVVLASYVLTMVYDIDAAIAEFSRVLKPGGALLTSDPVQVGNTTSIVDTTKVSSWYGQEVLQKYRVGSFRRIGDLDLIDRLSHYFLVRTYHARDPITGHRVTWFLGVNRGSVASNEPAFIEQLMSGLDRHQWPTAHALTIGLTAEEQKTIIKAARSVVTHPWTPDVRKFDAIIGRDILDVFERDPSFFDKLGMNSQDHAPAFFLDERLYDGGNYSVRAQSLISRAEQYWTLLIPKESFTSSKIIHMERRVPRNILSGTTLKVVKRAPDVPDIEVRSRLTGSLLPPSKLLNQRFRLDHLRRVVPLPDGQEHKFAIFDLSAPVFPDELGSVRFGDHRNGETICVGDGFVVLSRDSGQTWDLIDTPQCKGVQIINCFIANNTYLLQAVGIDPPADSPPGGRATIYVYDREWKFLGSSRLVDSHWHGCWSIGESDKTIIFADYNQNSDMYKMEFATNPERFRDTVRDGTICRSRDGGLSWEVVFSLPTDVARHFHTVQPDPFHPGTWWASTGDLFDECLVFRSMDDGDSWVDVTSSAVTTTCPGCKQRAFRFTAMAFTESGILWPTDDWLGPLKYFDQRLPVHERSGARLFFTPRGDKLMPSEVAYLGHSCRSMTDIFHGWIVTSEAKYASLSLRPQVFYIPKSDPSSARLMFEIDNYAYRGTGFTYARASRAAENGVFWTYRQGTDGLQGKAKAMRWSVFFE